MNLSDDTLQKTIDGNGYGEVQMPLVSVVMPVFNAALFVDQAVSSICLQSYKNLEIIIINDGSCDGTAGILKNLEKSDPRIIVKTNERNMGLVYSLNLGIALASGKYIARCDADDIAHECRIAKQVEFLESNQSISLVGVDQILVNEDLLTVSESRFPKSFLACCLTAPFSSPVSHTWLARKSLYERLGGYRDLCPVEDYDFLLRAISSNFRFCNLSYQGMKIRVSTTGITATNGLRQIRAFREVRRYFFRRLFGFSEPSLQSFKRKLNLNEIKSASYLLALNEWLQAKGRVGFCRQLCVAIKCCAISTEFFFFLSRRIIARAIVEFEYLLLAFMKKNLK